MAHIGEKLGFRTARRDGVGMGLIGFGFCGAQVFDQAFAILLESPGSVESVMRRASLEDHQRRVDQRELKQRHHLIHAMQRTHGPR
jgi:hypothetical protein